MGFEVLKTPGESKLYAYISTPCESPKQIYQRLCCGLKEASEEGINNSGKPVFSDLDFEPRPISERFRIRCNVFIHGSQFKKMLWIKSNFNTTEEQENRLEVIIATGKDEDFISIVKAIQEIYESKTRIACFDSDYGWEAALLAEKQAEKELDERLQKKKFDEMEREAEEEAKLSAAKKVEQMPSLDGQKQGQSGCNTIGAVVMAAFLLFMLATCSGGTSSTSSKKSNDAWEQLSDHEKNVYRDASKYKDAIDSMK